MIRLQTLSILVPVIALAACVSAPPPPEPQQAVRPAPAPLALAAPAAAGNWTERALTPGTWAWRTDSRGAVALYGAVGADAALAVRCDRSAQRMFISRPAAAGSQMVLRATTGAKTYRAQPTGGTPGYMAAELEVRDPQLDALAFSRGRFMIQLDGAPDVIVPAWPELTRVIEECR